MADNPQRRRFPAVALVYASALPRLQQTAREHGYALAVHGSMATDLDLIACPWTEDACDAQTLIEALRECINGTIRDETQWFHNPANRPHGRLAWSIYMNEYEAERQIAPYLDISVMPRIPAVPEPTDDSVRPVPVNPETCY